MGLLSFLFGNPNGTNAQGQNPNPGGTMLPGGSPSAYPPGVPPQALDSYLTPVPNGAGVVPNQSGAVPPPAHGALVKALAAAAPAAPGNQPPPPQDAGPPITVTGKKPIWANNAPDLGTPAAGDTWKPHHESLLGNLSDAILGTTIGQRDMRQNEIEALQTINGNPELAIARMAKVNPEMAERLYQEYNSMQHWNKAGDRQAAMTKNMQLSGFGDMAGRMMQGLAYDNNGNPKNITPDQYEAFRQQMYRIAGHQGLTPDDVDDLIPQQFTADTVPMITGLSKSDYHLAGLQYRNGQFQQRLPFMQGNMEASQTRARAAMLQAGNGAVSAQANATRAQTGVRAENHQETIHPGPVAPVAVTGDNSHAPAGILTPSKNPNIMYRQVGPYVLEYGKAGNKFVPTGRAMTKDAAGNPQIIQTHDLVAQHPELFRQ